MIFDPPGKGSWTRPSGLLAAWLAKPDSRRVDGEHQPAAHHGETSRGGHGVGQYLSCRELHGAVRGLQKVRRRPRKWHGHGQVISADP